MLFKHTYLYFRSLFCIHPSFRIIGLSEPPVVGSSTQQWLNSEMLTTFLFHHMRALEPQEELAVVKKLVRKTILYF